MVANPDKLSGSSMYEVGLVAGVSHQTVFRVLQGSDKVKESTRRRVEDAIAKLGYKPNLSARSLVTGRSKILGIISVESSDTGPISSGTGFEKGFTARARARGYFASSATVADSDPRELETALDYFLQQNFEGVVVLTPTMEILQALETARPELPLVTLGGSAVFPTNSVGLDQTEGAVLATEHLVALGHKRIAHIAGPSRRFDAVERQEGWRSTLQRHDLDSSLVWHGDWSARSGSHLARAVFDSGATAVFCANDQMALGILRAAIRDGIDVPANLSVVGFDDIPEAEFFSTPLTTVRQDFVRLGEDSAELLLSQIDDTIPAGEFLVHPSLVIRDSTRRPGAGQ